MIAECDRLIAAPVDVVWSLVSTSDGLCEWIAGEASVDLRPGGPITWTHADGSIVAGQVVEVTPMRRLTFTFGWVEGRFPIPPGSTTVTIQLEARAESTHVSVRHEGLDEVAAAAHTGGWTYFIDRLAQRAETGESLAPGVPA